MADSRAIIAGDAVERIGADLSPLEAGLQAASAKLKTWGASVSSIGASWKSFGGEIGAGLMGMIDGFRENAREIGRVSAVTGISAERLGELRYAAVQSGGELDDVAMSMTRLTHTLQKAASGSEDTIDHLRRMGVSVNEVIGPTVTMDQAFTRVRGAIGAMGAGMAQNNAAMEFFGRSGPGFLRFLGRSEADMQTLAREARELGLVMSGDDVRAASEMNREWRKLDLSMRAIKDTIGAALVPNMMDLLKLGLQVVTPVLMWTKANRGAFAILDKLAFYVVALGGTLIGLGTALRLAGAALAGFYPLLRLVGGVAAGAVAGVRQLWLMTTYLAGVAVRAGVAIGYGLYAALATVTSAAASAGVALFGLAAGPVRVVASAFAGLVGAVLYPVQLAFAGVMAAGAALGSGLLWLAGLPISAVIGGFSLIVGIAWSAAAAVAGAAVSITLSVVGGMGSAFAVLGGIVLHPVASLTAFVAASYAAVASALSGASASGILSAAMGALGVSEGTTAAVTGFLAAAIEFATIAFAVLSPVVAAAVAAYSAGSTASVIFAAGLTGLGLSQLQANALTLILTTTIGMFSGAVGVGTGAATILQAALLALGLTEGATAAITTYLAAAWLWLATTYSAGGLAAIAAAAGTVLLSVAQSALAAATAAATFVWGALVWTLGAASGALSITGIATWLLNAAVGVFNFVVAVAEAITGAWIIPLVALLIPIGLLVSFVTALAGGVVLLTAAMLAATGAALPLGIILSFVAVNAAILASFIGAVLVAAVISLGLAIASLASFALAAVAAVVLPFVALAAAVATAVGLLVYSLLAMPIKLAMAFLAAAWGAIRAAAIATWNAIVAAASAAWQWITGAAAATWNAILSGASAAWDGIVAGAGAAIAFLGERFAALGEGFLRVWRVINESIMAANWADALAVAWAAIKLGFVQTIGFFREQWQLFSNWLGEMFDQAWAGIMYGLRVAWAETIAVIRRGLLYLDPRNVNEDFRREQEREIDLGRQSARMQATLALQGAQNPEREAARIRAELVQAVRDGNAEDEARLREALEGEEGAIESARWHAALENWWRTHPQFPGNTGGTGLQSIGASARVMRDAAEVTGQVGASGIDPITRRQDDANRLLERMAQAIERMQVGGIEFS